MGVSLEGILGMQPLSLIAFPPWGAQLYSMGPCVARGHRQQSQKHWLRFLKIWSEKKHFFCPQLWSSDTFSQGWKWDTVTRGLCFHCWVFSAVRKVLRPAAGGFPHAGGVMGSSGEKHSLPKSAFSTVETYLLLDLFPSQSGKMQSSFCHDFAFNKMRNQKEALQCTISCVISLWFSSSRCA